VPGDFRGALQAAGSPRLRASKADPIEAEEGGWTEKAAQWTNRRVDEQIWKTARENNPTLNEKAARENVMSAACDVPSQPYGKLPRQ